MDSKDYNEHLFVGLISKSDFAPFVLLRGPHLQTIWALSLEENQSQKA